MGGAGGAVDGVVFGLHCGDADLCLFITELHFCSINFNVLFILTGGVGLGWGWGGGYAH